MQHNLFTPLKRCRPRCDRRGVSLVEMLAVMSANAVIIGAAVALLVTIGRADRGYDRRLNQQRVLSQLTTQLRTDLHAATQATWDESKSTLRLDHADGIAITYAAENERWVRRTLAANNNSEGELAGAFPTPAGLRTSIEPKQAGAGQLVRVNWMLPAPAASRDAPPSSVELTAIVGQDERLLHE
jgi:type II secretory pathway component PulJ